jgi:hypothetical protein
MFQRLHVKNLNLKSKVALLKGRTASAQEAPRELAIFAKKNKNKNKPTRFY